VERGRTMNRAQSTDIENDVNKLVDHFIATSGRTALRSKEEMDKALQCALAADQLTALRSEYQKKRSDYDFKLTHPLDAQIDEMQSSLERVGLP